MTDTTSITSMIRLRMGAHDAHYAGKLVTLTNEAAITLTVPAATFSAGQRVDIAQRGAGAVTVVGSSVTVNAPPGRSLVLQGQYAYCSLVFISASVADLVGATVAA